LDFGFVGPFIISIVAIVSGCVVAIVATIARNQVRALEIRERIAMIEKGLVPPPEVDPGGFDREMNRYDRRAMRRHGRHGSFRHRRVGITFMGIGFGLMVLIAVSGDSLREGLGVGGFFVVLGLAFFINALFEPVSASDADSPVTPKSQPPVEGRHEDSRPSQWQPPSSPPEPHA
jgi:hypothetical protein